MGYRCDNPRGPLLSGWLGESSGVNNCMQSAFSRESYRTSQLPISDAKRSIDIFHRQLQPFRAVSETETSPPCFDRLRWEGPSSTTRSFDARDVLFIEENPHADFSTPWSDTVTDEFEDLFSWLDTPFMSSAVQCYALEDYYEECLHLVRGHELESC